jgi:hypothetical protein
MSKQTKRIIGFGDLKAFVLTCTCGSSVSLNLNGTVRPRAPYNCPSCNRDWDPARSPTGFNAAINEYMGRHRTLREALGTPAAEQTGYTVCLEVDTDNIAPVTEPNPT